MHISERPTQAGHHEDVGVGEQVIVRRQKWRVTELAPGDNCQIVTLAGVGRLNLQVQRQVVSPFDRLDAIRSSRSIRFVTIAKWRRACRALLAALGTTGTLRSAAQARIDLLPHQLEPALAIVRGLGSRVLIADEVGLGKTIEAGLVIAELLARGAVDRTLVLTPAGLRDQWASELSSRFGIEAAVVDARAVRHRTKELPVDINPWQTVPVAISSVDYVKRAEVLPVVTACRWDVVVVDEVHGVTPASDRCDAVSTLCRNAVYVVLLTATPHAGDPRAFESLCGLGSLENDRLLIFRRSRREIGWGSGRRVHRLLVAPSRPEREMHDALARLLSAAESGLGAPDPDVRLALETLRKRAYSSPHSLERSVARRIDAPKAADSTRQLPLPLDEDHLIEDQEPDLPASLLPDKGEETRLLEAVDRSAQAACLDETKLNTLDRLLRRLKRRREAAIVFTEYRDTLLHVQAVLGRAASIVHGGLSPQERRSALDSFTQGRHSLLLTTDAASEGLNLHQTCRVVINLELPWNPVRLEQRIGRVDRIGQTRRVHIFHLIAQDTGELAILGRLRDRVARAQADVGGADPLTSGNRDWETDRVARCESLRLDEDARAEHVRLSGIRRLLSRNSDPSDLLRTERPFANISARPSCRSFLRRRLLVIVETILEDSLSRIAASHAIPLLIPLPKPVTSVDRGYLDALILALRDIDLDSLDPTLTEWRMLSLLVHRTFWETHAARVRAILETTAGLSHSPFQAGLFDRRAEFRRNTEVLARAHRAAEGLHRLARADAAAVCVVQSNALLMLAPKLP